MINELDFSQCQISYHWQYFIFRTKFSRMRGLILVFECVLLRHNFDFLLGYLVVTTRYLVVIASYCSLLVVTSRYHLFPLLNRDKTKPQFKVTLEELKNFKGLIFLSGYNIRLAERDSWSVDPDLRCDAFCGAMSRNRFFGIKSFLHADDHQSLSESRMTKVETLYDLLNEKNQQFGIAHEDLLALMIR